MSSTNIPIQGLEAVVDPAYRWQMPRVESSAKKQGTNGAFTLVSNMANIAACLHRSPAEVSQFLGIELSCRASWRPSDGETRLAGGFTQQTVQNAIFKYIEVGFRHGFWFLAITWPLACAALCALPELQTPSSI